MNSYVEELEMRLRFAEEEAQERERIAYKQGQNDAIDEFATRLSKYLLTVNTAYDVIMEVAEQMKGENDA